jgi:DNA-binding transcriptional LysR family regulator
MNIADLRSFLVVAQHANLRSAAEALHQSPSALSKAIRRIELALDTPVFDRVARTIRLNAHGERLRHRAQQLVALADQTQAEFRGDQLPLQCRIAGPPVLLWRYAPAISTAMKTSHTRSEFTFVSSFEDKAIAALARGEVDFALATGAAVDTTLPGDLAAVPLGRITMKVVAGLSHPLVDSAPKSQRQANAVSVQVAQVLTHPFACMKHASFSGAERGTRSDGWREDKLPRQIRFWVDDIQLLLTLVRSGHALAYLPDFSLVEPGLVRLQVGDCPYDCVDDIYLVWRPEAARDWQNHLVSVVRNSHARNLRH